MSPAFNAVLPWGVSVLGGRQFARTFHFFVSSFPRLFLIVHVTMVILSGFATRMRKMTSGPPALLRERQ